jgi:uncharacterized membrane protein
VSFWMAGELHAGGHLEWLAPRWHIAVAGLLVLFSLLGAWATRRSAPKALPLELLLWGLALACLMVAAAEPVWISEEGRTEGGKFVVLVDSSASMAVKEGGVERSEEAQELLRKIRKDVGGIVEVYGFSGELEPGAPVAFDGRESDIGVALHSVADRYLGQELRGIALITDGIDRGTLRRNASELSDDQLSALLPELTGPLSIYPIGRNESLYDAAVLGISSGGFAYLRTPFTLNAKVKGSPNGKISVGLYREGKAVRTFGDLQEKLVQLDEEGLGEARFEVRPMEVGRFAWEVRIPVEAEDAAPGNNSYPVVIKVVRDRIRVLQVSGSPSYDQKFLRLFLKQDPSVDLVSFFILRTQEDFGAGWQDDELSLIAFPYEKLFSADLDSFDLVVFQNFNYAPYFGYDSQDLLQNISDYVLGGKAFAITGGDLSFDLGEYSNTPIEEILPVRLGVPGDSASEEKFVPELAASGAKHPITRLSSNVKENSLVWSRLGEMDGFNRNMGLSDESAALLVHPSEKTAGGQAMPILAVKEAGKGRVMSLGVDSSWRWSFSEAVEGSGNQAYLRFWKNSLRWLVADPEDRPVAISPSRENALIGEELLLQAKVRDVSYEPVPEATIVGNIQTPKGDLLPFSAETGPMGTVSVPFVPTEQGTHLVTVRSGSDQAETVFAATMRDPELLELRPDYPFLQRLADITEGKLTGGLWSSRSFSAPLVRSDAQRVVPMRSTTPLGRAPIWALLFVLFGCLSWWVRRQNGGR